MISIIRSRGIILITLDSEVRDLAPEVTDINTRRVQKVLMVLQESARGAHALAPIDRTRNGGLPRVIEGRSAFRVCIGRRGTLFRPEGTKRPN
jgi:hypothetical protein